MPSKLLIVESPGKIKKLSQILGSDWLVKASVGHIRELASDGDDSLGFDIDSRSVRCRFIARGDRGAKTIQGLKAAVRQVKTVVLATDPDREGETIAWHLQEALNLKNPQRVVYSEITPNAVRAAIAQPRTIDLDMVNSGLCRTVLDKLVGYRGSPLLWQLQNGAKSMGRVQSAALHILCTREREIQAFVPQDYWSVFVDYAEGFRAYYQGSAAETSEEEAPDDAAHPSEQSAPESARVTSEAEANRLVEIAQQHPHRITSVEGKTTNRKPPPPFITSSLQQTAGSRLRFSPEQTMKVAQSLYEAGLITYMRTDSTMLSPEFCAQARQWLESNDLDNVPAKVAQHRKAKGAQEAHEAIRPTDIYRPSADLKSQLSADAFSLYVMIWKRAIASQCKPAQVQQTKINTQSSSVCWQAKGQVVIFPGYTRYWNNLKADAELPRLPQGQVVTLQQATHEQKQTQPPPRYSEPKLVQMMERKGIGRPSTYAPTIQTLKQRLYVEMAKGSLLPTALGLEVDAFLKEALPDLLEASFTAQMEQALDQIAEGKEDWQRYLSGWNQEYFIPALTKAQQVVPKHISSTPVSRSGKALSKTPCPQCQKPMAKVPSTKVQKKYFLKCVSGCEDVVLFYSKYSKQWEPPRAKGSEGPKLSSAKATLTEHSCPVCQKQMEEYGYEKDGKAKKLLRCSDTKARNQAKHKEAVYFQTDSGWWSPKHGNLENSVQKD
ncbi:MAG: type I DNA topoisomerase [Phormidesmis priestleyi]|uniref:DNA topoisomerase 1 n=1 Tax=Phormidesmis priestleyi TaxID=268141 RepID=A0A2W4XPX4_9CYAN|nr:MAG: type I DNA topoisomerase [Phormidesmis priestleyi]